ncbi:MAG: hypothetical protein HC905_21290 [Bacteroidales bacterium]|nr:hypothetical protein [Bacteroidales bacterium]
MKKLLTNLVFVLFSGSLLFAQADFRKGYIVKLNGDTLHGYVNFQKESVNTNVCQFKRFEIAIPLSYSPQNISAYGIDGEKQYTSIKYSGKQYFAEYLVMGKISLLYLKRGSDKFLVLEEKKVPVELKSGRMTDGHTTNDFDDYKEFLKLKLAQSALEKEIEDSRLSISSLTFLFQKYNESVNQLYHVPFRPKDRSLITDYNLLGTNRIKVGLFGGFGYNLIRTNAFKDSYKFMYNADFSSSKNPALGLFIRRQISSRLPVYSLQFEVCYEDVSLYGFSKSKQYNTIDIYDDIAVDYQSLCFALKLNYSIPVSKVNLLPHAGVGYVRRFNPQYERYSMKVSSQEVFTYKYLDFNILESDLI